VWLQIQLLVSAFFNISEINEVFRQFFSATERVFRVPGHRQVAGSHPVVAGHRRPIPHEALRRLRTLGSLQG